MMLDMTAQTGPKTVHDALESLRVLLRFGGRALTDGASASSDARAQTTFGAANPQSCHCVDPKGELPAHTGPLAKWSGCQPKVAAAAVCTWLCACVALEWAMASEPAVKEWMVPAEVPTNSKSATCT